MRADTFAPKKTMRRTISIILVVLSTFWVEVVAQNNTSIKGQLVDAGTGEALPGASVVHQTGKGTITDIEGVFRLEVKADSSYHQLKIYFVGYERMALEFNALNENHDLGRVALKAEEIAINEVQVNGKVPIAVQKGDTLSFKASAVKVNDDAIGINLIKKLPGFKTGEDKIEVQGEKVQKIYIDGKPFFEDDPKQALNALPADVIKSIELYDDYGEIAAFTGYASGNSVKAINIITKEGSRKNWLGSLSAGLGTDAYYDVENTIMYANEKHDLTILNDNNNVNKSRADMSDFKSFEAQVQSKLGLVSANEPLAGEQNTRNIAANYHFEPNDKTQLSLDYTYGKQENTLEQLSSQNYQDALFYDISDTTHSDSYRHKINLKYNYEKGNDKLIVSGKFSYIDGSFHGITQKDGYTANSMLNTSRSENTTSSEQLYSGTTAIWLHKFGDSGRSLATIANLTLQQNDKNSMLGADVTDIQGSELLVDNKEVLDGTDNKVFARIAYKEPLSIFSNLNFVLSSTYGWSSANKEAMLTSAQQYSTNWVMDESYFNYNINRAELGYSSMGLKFVFNAGLGFEQSSTDKSFLIPEEDYETNHYNYAIHPLLFGKCFISSKQTLSFLVRSSTVMPSITQLQPTVTMTEPLKVTIGNPNLEQGVQFMGVARYVQTNSEKSRFFSAYVFARYSDNFVGVKNYFTDEVQNVYGYQLAAGTNVFQPVNMDGYFNLMAGSDYAFPVKLLRSNLNIGMKYTYSEIPAILQDVELTAFNHSGALNISLASNISQKVDFLLSNELIYNHSSNSESDNETRFLQNNLKLEASIEFIDSWKLGLDGNYSTFNYFDDYQSQDYMLLNASITKQFLKEDRASIELRAYDILNQNQGVNFSIHETYTEQIQSNSLKQYVMLTFKYKF